MLRIRSSSPPGYAEINQGYAISQIPSSALLFCWNHVDFRLDQRPDLRMLSTSRSVRIPARVAISSICANLRWPIPLSNHEWSVRRPTPSLIAAPGKQVSPPIVPSAKANQSIFGGFSVEGFSFIFTILSFVSVAISFDVPPQKNSFRSSSGAGLRARTAHRSQGSGRAIRIY
jgi:hypothetical protein